MRPVMVWASQCRAQVSVGLTKVAKSEGCFSAGVGPSTMQPLTRLDLRRLATDTLDYGSPVPYDEVVAAAVSRLYENIISAAENGQMWYSEEIRVGGVPRGGLTPFIMQGVMRRLSELLPGVTVRNVYQATATRLHRYLEVVWA